MNPFRFLLAGQLGAVLRRNSAGAAPRGPRRGVVPGPGTAVSVLVVGDSTVNGADIPTHALSLGGQLAAALSARTRRTVHWAVLARGGVTPDKVLEKYVPKMPRYDPDVIVIGLGANCMPQGYSTREWARALEAMLGGLRSRVGAVPVVLTAMPPAHLMKAVPQPLRTYWALRNHLYDAETRRLVRSRPAVTFGPPYAAGKKEYLGPDGCHPSAEGYSIWAERLTDTIVPLLSGHESTVGDRRESIALPAHKSAW